VTIEDVRGYLEERSPDCYPELIDMRDSTINWGRKGAKGVTPLIQRLKWGPTAIVTTSDALIRIGAIFESFSRMLGIGGKVEVFGDLDKAVSWLEAQTPSKTGPT
jgi:hypothetical protein